MRAGDLRHRIEIQTIGTTRGAAGEVVDTWTTEKTVWASVEPLKGGEMYAAKQINADTTHKIRLWYLHGLTPAKRILFGTRVFNIQQVLNVEERGIEHLLYCQEMI
jgi:SPP1 family predicted phage head-tail adaptor